MIRKTLSLLSFTFLLGLFVSAQGSEAAEIYIRVVEEEGIGVGETAKLQVAVQPKGDWYVYSAIPSDEMAYNPTTITYDMTSQGFEAAEKIEEKGEMHSEYDDIMGGTLRYYKGDVVFTQEVKLTEEHAVLEGTFDYMACNGFKCIMFSEDIKLNLQASK